MNQDTSGLITSLEMRNENHSEERDLAFKSKKTNIYLKLQALKTCLLE